MKKAYYLSLILSFMSLVSCRTRQHKNTTGLSFQWSIAGKSPDSSGLAGAVIGVSNHALLIGGGANFPDGMPWAGGKKVYQEKLFVFKKTRDSLINIPDVFHLPYPLAYSANCSTDKGIVAVGGENEKGPVDKVLLINWDSVSNKPVISYLPDLKQPCTDGAVAVSENKIYFAGGIDTEGVSNKFVMLNLDDTAAGWQTLPSLPKPVSHTVLYIQNNGRDTCIYLVGGRKENKDSVSDLYNEVYQFDLKTNQWTQKTSLPYALSAQAGVPWGDSSLLVFSGDRGKTFHATEILLMKIAHEKNSNEKQKLITEKNTLQKSHPSYPGDVLLYNTHSDTWIKTDSIPFPGQVTTTAIKWGNEIIIPCGEIRAGVRTPDIVVGKVSE